MAEFNKFDRAAVASMVETLTKHLLKYGTDEDIAEAYNRLVYCNICSHRRDCHGDFSKCEFSNVLLTVSRKEE